ncbi:MAG: dienelactone hydrolase family protein [Xanthomonadaceae bacterium]|nr:dienelactone hydrolase family protein [Xanthomonadaceae bacterium]MDE1958452.1 dienelactone hydrolase family protein [Xanthomonadaceae bacterium]MDE2176872.1 dienelactone hydrolase family protein [Xanthomonadaceae bacterium]MDE2245717.1 dienelactone hydrolase family protein [Xanthomonadaceae bacterium]
MQRLVILFGLLLVAGVARAAMVARPVSWTLDGTTFRSVLVYDDAVSAPRPGLVMVPNWYGVNADAVAKAKMIAGRRYVILLVDLYGEGVRPAGTRQAQAAVKPLYADRALMRARMVRALAELRAQERHAPIDPARIAAIGFCFGGSAVLDLARAGADVAAVVTFHGILSTDDPALAKHIKARVLVLTGDEDQAVPPAARSAFEQEMRAGGVKRWAVVDFGGAVHCFTEAAQKPAPNCVYDPPVAKRAYQFMRVWLDDAFAGRP